MNDDDVMMVISICEICIDGPNVSFGLNRIGSAILYMNIGWGSRFGDDCR
jgi:hypothetical protein